MNGQGDCATRGGRGGDRATASESLRRYGAHSRMMVALQRSCAQAVVVVAAAADADLCCRVLGGVRVVVVIVVVVVVVGRELLCVWLVVARERERERN